MIQKPDIFFCSGNCHEGPSLGLCSSVPGSHGHEATPSVYEAHFQRVILFQLIKEATEPSDLVMILKSRKAKLGNHAETELAEVQTTWPPAQHPLHGLRAAKLKYFLSPVLLIITQSQFQKCKIVFIDSEKNIRYFIMQKTDVYF